MTMQWNLSTLDLFVLNMVIDGAWIYQQMPDEQKMHDALKLLIKTYPHLTGHYQEKIKAVVWNEEVLEEPKLEIIENRNCSVQELLSKSINPWSLVKKYDIEAFKKGKIMPFSATMVKLKDGAVLIVQCAHAVMDGYSFYRLMEQWAALSKGELIEPMTIGQNLLPKKDALTKAETIEQSRQRGWVMMSVSGLIKMLWNMFRQKFVKDIYVQEVSLEELSQLKHDSGAGTHAVLSAIAAKEIMSRKAKRNKFKVVTVADLRGHVSGISETFMGNLSQPFITHEALSTDLDIMDLAKAIQKQNDSVLHGDELDSNLRLSICSSHYGLPFCLFDMSEMSGSQPKSLYINNQLKFRACELDFGYGRPLYAFPNQLSDAVKFWQPVSDQTIHIIYSGFMARLMHCRQR